MQKFCSLSFRSSSTILNANLRHIKSQKSEALFSERTRPTTAAVKRGRRPRRGWHATGATVSPNQQGKPPELSPEISRHDKPSKSCQNQQNQPDPVSFHALQGRVSPWQRSPTLRLVQNTETGRNRSVVMKALISGRGHRDVIVVTQRLTVHAAAV